MTENHLPSSGNVKEKLRFWSAQLRDMGRRNRLLYFKDTQASSLVITEPEALEIFEHLVVKSKPIYAPLPPKRKQKALFDIDDDADKEAEKDEYIRGTDEFFSTKKHDRINPVLSNLRYRARTIREEQGFNALYMAFGILKWQDGQESEINEAPLVLVPIDIDRESLGARFAIQLLEEEIVVNPTLQTKLLNDFNIQLDEIPNELTTDDLLSFWQEIGRLVKNYPDWEVIPKVVVGIFNFQTLMLIKDLEHNENIYVNHPLIKMLSGHLENLLAYSDDVPEGKDLDEKVNPNFSTLHLNPN